MFKIPRIKVSETPCIAADGSAFFVLYDRTDETPVTRHVFMPGGDRVAEANRNVAQAIADAMNAAPGVAIDSIRLALRTGVQADRISRRSLQLSAA